MEKCRTHEEVNGVCQRIGYILDNDSSRGYASSFSARKHCDEHRYSYEWINGQEPHLNKTVFECSATLRISFRLVVGSSASSSSGSYHSTSMTLSRWEIDHLTFSSSNSSPTTTVSSESEIRAREDLSGIDSHSALVSSSYVERTEPGDPLTKPTKNPKPNKNEKPRDRTRRLVLFRRTGMDARIQRKSRG